MIRTIIIIIVFMLSHCLQLNIKNSQFADIINDFMKYHYSAKVTFYLCWKKDEIKQLVKTNLENQYYSYSIQTISEFKDFTWMTVEQHQFYVIDVNCDGVEKLLICAENKKLFNQPYRWLLLNNSNDTKVFENINIGIYSQFYVIELSEMETAHIRAYFKYSRNSILTSNEVAVWTKDRKFSYFNHPYSSKRMNLHGTVLTTSIVFSTKDSLSHIWDYRDTHIDIISKLNYILITLLSNIMNSTNNFTVTNTWGYLIPNTTKYNGMFGEVREGRADIAGSSALISNERLEFVDSVGVTTPSKILFILRAPSFSTVKNIYLHAFHTSTWIAVLVLAVALFIVLYIVMYCEWHDRNLAYHFRDVVNLRLRSGTSNVIIFETSIVTQQGSYEEPRTTSGRIVTIFALVILMFLYTAYNANIIVLLQSTSNSVKTLNDFITTNISLGAHDIAYLHYYLKIQTEPIKKTIYEKVRFMNITQGIKKVQNEFFAFIVDLSSGYGIIKDTFLEHEKCEIHEVDYLHVPYPYFFVEKNSSYREIIKIGTKMMKERGVHKREVLKFYERKPKCQGRVNTFTSVGMKNSVFAFELLLGGFLACLIVFILEIITKRYQIYFNK